MRNLTERQTRALALAQGASAGVSVGDLNRAYPGWCVESWRRDLVALAAAGLLRATGDRRGRRYLWPRGEARSPFHRVLDYAISAPPDKLGQVVELLEREAGR